MSTSRPALVLASSSPSRRKQLRLLNLPFVYSAPNVDETPGVDERPAALAVRLAEAKAQAIAPDFPDALIIAGDQTAEIDGVFLEKPGDRDAAVAQLRTQRGKDVEFQSGLCVLNGSTGTMHSGVARTTVRFRELQDDEIDYYVDLEKPFDCAGSFRAEGAGIGLFEWIKSNDPSAITGMPLILLVSLLRRHGYSVFRPSRHG